MKDTIGNLASDQYMGIPELEDLHQQSREWLSDMAFWKDEADFLKKLIDKNFVHLMTGEGLSTAIRLSDKISRLGDTDVKNLMELIKIHEVKLAELISKPNDRLEDSYRREHRNLAAKFRDLAMQNMSVKRRIFASAEKILHDEKIKALTTH